MKRALVLAGGGSKGAYEVGFIKALKELNIEYNIITGTSIGALNGCLLAQGDYQELIDLWNNMNINTVFNGEFSDDFSFLDFDKIINQSNLVASFFKSSIKEKGADITPLKELIRGLLDEDKLLSSPIDFGLCTVEFPSLNPILITKNEMKKEYIFNYLIASASCFPAFPMHNFNNKSYIDGGYYDNVPIDLAFSMGADEVIVVDLKMVATHPNYLHKPKVKYIHPYVDLGMFLDFTREALDRNIQIGYNTCMKAYNALEGVSYTFNRYDSVIFDLFYNEVSAIERSIRLDTIMDVGDSLFIKIEEGYDFNLSIKQYLYVVMDWILELLNIDNSQIYTFEDISKVILKEFEKYSSSNYKFIDKDAIFDNFREINKKGIIGRIYHQLLFPLDEIVKNDKLVSFFTKEFLMAKALYFIYINQIK